MDRRPAGVVLLVVALVAVVVVPALSGRRTVGSAVAKTFPLPPQVGDCLQPPFPVSMTRDVPPEIPITETRFGSCADLVGGELVQVWPNAADAAAGSARSGPCYRSAAGFAGLDISGWSVRLAGSSPEASVRWRPSIAVAPYHVVPSKQERSAGRSWVACLAAPVGLQSYQGTLRAAFTEGSLPAAYGSCWAGTDLDQTPLPVSCDHPHAAELLATGWARNRASPTVGEIDESCSVLAAGIMRTADPTRGGALQILADRFSSGVSGQPYAAGMIGCFVAAPGRQQLSGTLVGLGDRPIPLVS